MEMRRVRWLEQICCWGGVNEHRSGVGQNSAFWVQNQMFVAALLAHMCTNPLNCGSTSVAE